MCSRPSPLPPSGRPSVARQSDGKAEAVIAHHGVPNTVDYRDTITV